MHLDPPDHTEAAQRYYAAFPALKKGEESPQQYYLPPPAWCRKSAHKNTQLKMQSDLSLSKEFNNHMFKKIPTGKERRNSYHGQRKGSKKRCHSYSRSFESKENLPEWVTHEGVWDIEAQDPIKEFIKAIALDEGYGTCENTVTDELRELTQLSSRMNEIEVPEWDDGLDLQSEWLLADNLVPREHSPLEDEIYAKFEAKFNSSIEALWSNDQGNTPDDEYQELPIDFQDLLASPSDLLVDPTGEKCSLISLTESIWSNDAYDSFLGISQPETPTRSVEILHDRFKPLNLTDDVFKADPKPKTPLLVVQESEPFSLYSYEGIYEAVPTVSDVMRSLTAINHCKDLSSFAEVVPRRPGDRARPAAVERVDSCPQQEDEEDLLVSDKTHFRPIRKEGEAVAVPPKRYADGDTFDIVAELQTVHFHRSDSGFIYLDAEVDSPKRYLEYRTRSIDYSRLNLTEAQRRDNDMSNFVEHGFKLKFPVRMMEKAVQTSEGTVGEEGDVRAAWACDECGRRGGAKKMRQSGIESIWSDAEYCGHCSVGIEQATLPPPDELSREWEELLSDISAAHAQYATEASSGGADRKRRHSAALRCRPHAACSHPHAPFLHCAGSDRPLTR